MRRRCPTKRHIERSIAPGGPNSLQTLNRMQLSEELRLAAAKNDKFEWVTGLYFTHYKLDDNEPGILIANFGGGEFTENTFSHTNVRTEDYAGFGDATFHSNPDFRVFAGARWTHSRRASTACGSMMDGEHMRQLNIAGRVIAGLLGLCGACAAAEPPREVSVDAGTVTGTIRSLQGVDGLPVGADGAGVGIEDGPDVRNGWRQAHVDVVRTYIWHTRLDTVDNPGSLFPKWEADPEQPASYNFKTVDLAVRATHDAGAQIMFTIASAIPQNNLPPPDLKKWSAVLDHIVRHFTKGWAQGFDHGVRYWEVGDEPDLNKFHFRGTPEQFYAMYAAAAKIVKAVDPALKVGGPGLAFPLNTNAPFREGFLDFVKHERLPFDFFSWKWFGDASEDPYDFHRVAEVTTSQLQARGLTGVQQFISNWNFDAIPTARPDRLTMGVYECAALSYMQDTKIDRAFIFRGDAAMDNPKYKLGDFTTQMFNKDGSPMVNAWGFIAMGQMQLTRERLKVTGGDNNGYVVLAGRDEEARNIQVLITNYAIAPKFLEPTTKNSLDFELPVDGERVPVSWALPTRRTDAVQSNNGGYRLKVRGVSCKSGCVVERRRLDGTHAFALIDSNRLTTDTIELSADTSPPSIELITIRKQ